MQKIEGKIRKIMNFELYITTGVFQLCLWVAKVEILQKQPSIYSLYVTQIVYRSIMGKNKSISATNREKNTKNHEFWNIYCPGVLQLCLWVAKEEILHTKNPTIYNSYVPQMVYKSIMGKNKAKIAKIRSKKRIIMNFKLYITPGVFQLCFWLAMVEILQNQPVTQLIWHADDL